MDEPQLIQKKHTIDDITFERNTDGFTMTRDASEQEPLKISDPNGILWERIEAIDIIEDFTDQKTIRRLLDGALGSEMKSELEKTTDAMIHSHKKAAQKPSGHHAEAPGSDDPFAEESMENSWNRLPEAAAPEAYNPFAEENFDDPWDRLEEKPKNKAPQPGEQFRDMLPPSFGFGGPLAPSIKPDNYDKKPPSDLPQANPFQDGPDSILPRMGQPKLELEPWQEEVLKMLKEERLDKLKESIATQLPDDQPFEPTFKNGLPSNIQPKETGLKKNTQNSLS